MAPTGARDLTQRLPDSRMAPLLSVRRGRVVVWPVERGLDDHEGGALFLLARLT